MNTTCKKIRETLAAEGPRALGRDDAAQQHLAECSECFTFLESLSQIENGLQDMATLDAPDHVVESLLARSELAQATPGAVEPAGWRRALANLLRARPLVWSSVAAGLLVFVFAIGVRFQGPDSPTEPFTVASNIRKSALQLADKEREALEVGAEDDNLGLADGRKDVASLKPDARPAVQAAPQSQLRKAGEDEALLRQIVEKQKRLKNVPSRLEKPFGKVGSKNEIFRLAEDQAKAPAELEAEEVDRFGDEAVADLSAAGRYYQNKLTLESGVQDSDGEDPNLHGSRSRDFKNLDSIEEMEIITGGESRRSGSVSGPALAGVAGVSNPVLLEDGRVEPTYPQRARRARIETRVVVQAVVRADGTVGDVTVLEADHPNLGFEQAAIDAVKQWRYQPATRDGKPVDVFFAVVVDFKLDGVSDNSGLRRGSAVRVAQAFLDERASLAGLTFRPATGYWSTGYVPGDPALRLLQSRLQGWDRSALQLHNAARQVGQPFDAPQGSALAIYLHADRRGITDEGRVLLQVGLQGTQRHAGRRPAMNLAIVLDLREPMTDDVAIGLRSLIDAFNRAQEPGDRFRLFVAGRSEDLVVDSKDFRHGYLKVTLDRLLAQATPSGKRVQIVDAVRTAIECIAAADDPETPLGSSAVIMITPGALGHATRTLAGMAHESAVAGIPVSVIGVGPGVDLSEIDFVTLAGQGSRRLLQHASDAADLVDRELSAASRAIARAVRLRIRLAPGVRLINILGSERLDETRAQQVRDAERSLDLRLSRNLGIQADRGEDEEGIQVVIPSFYAGDSHVMLLELVVPGPGPVVDVTVRYKDLAHLRNAVSRASLGLGRDTRPNGPLERNVLKNLLSFRLSETLDEAGRSLAAGDAARATELLENFQSLLSGLRLEVPGLDHDTEIIRDIAMLDEYRTLLANGQYLHLSDSLRYAAMLKLQPHPMET